MSIISALGFLRFSLIWWMREDTSKMLGVVSSASSGKKLGSLLFYIKILHYLVLQLLRIFK